MPDKKDEISNYSSNYWRVFKEWCDLCTASYESPSEASKILLDEFVFIEDKETDAQCYVIYNRYTTFIVFRGTSTLTDWKADLNISQEEMYGDKHVKIHRGFKRQYWSVKDDILKCVEKNLYRPIVVIGHSLGGALAQVCAVDIKMRHNVLCDISVFTIGSPRVGNRSFVNLYNKMIKNSYRLKNKGDVITYFPMKSSYCHVHSSICFDKGDVSIEPITKKCLRRLARLCGNVNVFDSVEKHSIEEYKKNLVTMETRKFVIDCMKNTNNVKFRL